MKRNSQPGERWILAVIAFMLVAVCAPILAEVKIEEQDVGPVGQPQDVKYVVSPRGGHLASVTRKGSRMVVIVDGVTGPKFDEIVTPTVSWVDPRRPQAEVLAAGTATFNSYPLGPVIFSRDGKRSAYVGRLSQEWVLMVDGKESVRIPVAGVVGATSGIAGNAGNTDIRMEFTGEDGKHLLFAKSVFNGMELWVDGQKMPGTYFSGGGGTQGTTDPLVSPDGARIAYIAQIDRDKSTVIVDGKDAGFVGDNLAFTADSQHLFAFVRQGAITGLSVDGKLKMKTDGINQLVMAPTGNGFAVVLQRLNPPGEFLVVNGRKVEGSDCASIAKVVISPDGKHFAALCSLSPTVKYVLWDGKKGQEYFNIDADVPGLTTGMQFSPDSSKLGYVASLNNKKFIVINEEESDGFDNAANFKFSPDSKHVVMTGLQGSSAVLIIDNKVTRRPANSMPVIDSVLFSPDGAHYAYFCGGNIRDGGAIFVDGKETGLTGLYTFSPDSKHVAVVGYRPTDNMRGIFLDGTLVYQSDANSTVRYRMFTPDSQHLCWLAAEAATGPNAAPGSYEWVTYQDGKPVARCDRTQAADQIFGGFNSQFEKMPRAWTVEADGVLTVLGPVNEVVKRHRITPAADTSVATLITDAEAKAKGRNKQ